jgi:hypothetical protein
VCLPRGDNCIRRIIRPPVSSFGLNSVFISSLSSSFFVVFTSSISSSLPLFVLLGADGLFHRRFLLHLRILVAFAVKGGATAKGCLDLTGVLRQGEVSLDQMNFEGPKTGNRRVGSVTLKRSRKLSNIELPQIASALIPLTPPPRFCPFIYLPSGFFAPHQLYLAFRIASSSPYFPRIFRRSPPRST